MKVAYLKDWIEVRPLDWKYLGQRLPGDPQEHQKLLEMFQGIVDQKGPEWVSRNRNMLLEGAKDILPDL